MVGREILMRTASQLPARHPVVKRMLESWLEQTRIREDSDATSIEYVDVTIMHSAMKYRLGFLSKAEVLSELAESGEALASEKDSEKLQIKLSQLIDSIKDDTFEVVTSHP